MIVAVAMADLVVEAAMEVDEGQDLAEAAGAKHTEDDIDIPPDPRELDNDCVEVTHIDHISLAPSRGGFVLEHKVIGETHFFPYEVSLHFHGKYAYVKEPEGVKWVNSIFKQSLWSTKDNKWLILHQDLDGWSAQWLDKVSQADYIVRYIKWPTSMADAPPFTCTVVKFTRASRKTVSIYWDLDSCEYLAPKGSVWVRERVSKRWGTMLQDHGLGADEHVKHSRQSIAKAGVKLEHTSLSTAVVVLLLSKWAGKCPQPLKEAASRLMPEFMSRTCCHKLFSIHIVVDAECSPDFFAERIGDVRLEVCNLQVSVKPLTHSDKWNRLPLALRHHCPFTRNAQLPVHELLQLLGSKPNWCWLLSQLVHSISKHIDSRWSCISGMQIAPPSYNWMYYGRKDPEVRRMLAAQALSCRKKRKSELAPDSNGVKHVAHSDWHVAREIREQADAYLGSMQTTAGGAHHVALCNDGSRLGGRDRLHGAMMDMQSGWTWWAPTQAR